MALKYVWEPIRIGSVEIKNRVARSSTTTRMYPPSLDDDFAAFHAARARGGVGLSILEAGGVHPNAQLAYLADKAAMPGFEKLMAAVRPYGMRIFQQLWHGGHVFANPVTGEMPWAPSATPSPITGVVGVPMGQPEIDEIVAAFGEAARCCRDGGLDGVEVHGGHGYLIQQFLSPLTNRREDGYNGSLLERSRFFIEVLRSVRAAVGPGYPVGVRMGASIAAGGLSAKDVGTVAAHLESLGLIDFIDITHGDYFDPSEVAHSMAYPSGYQLAGNEPIAKAVKVPRLVTGRYRTLEEADQVLRDGQADLVSLARAHIADPNIVKKTQAGRVEDVRPCIACSQGCLGGLLTVGRMQCTVNPAAGYELALDEELITKVAAPKKVMIVGGGPSGMEAARIAALRGHKVVLVEAGAKLGGTLQIARRAPHLHILGDLVDWLERQVYALGVEVRMNTYIETEDILNEQPDALIVATGAMTEGDGRQAKIPGEPPPGMDLPHVFDAAGVIMTPARDLKGKSAMVFDDVGRYPAVAAAEFLARAGAAVTFVTSLASYAPKMYGTFRDDESLARLNQGDFRLLVRYDLIEIQADHCLVRPYGARKTERIAADVAVVVTSQIPIRNLFDELRARIPDVRLVGDAHSPRDLLAAMHDGHRVARVI